MKKCLNKMIKLPTVSLFLFVILFETLLVGCRNEINYQEDTEKIWKEVYKNYHPEVFFVNFDGVKLDSAFDFIVMENIDEDRLIKSDDGQFGCVVILDRKGTSELNTEKLTFLKQFSLKSHYDIWYIGKKYKSLFVELGMVQYVNEEECDICYNVSAYDGDLSEMEFVTHGAHGLWDVEMESRVDNENDVLNNCIVHGIKNLFVFSTQNKQLHEKDIK